MPLMGLGTVTTDRMQVNTLAAITAALGIVTSGKVQSYDGETYFDFSGSKLVIKKGSIEVYNAQDELVLTSEGLSPAYLEHILSLITTVGYATPTPFEVSSENKRDDVIQTAWGPSQKLFTGGVTRVGQVFTLTGSYLLLNVKFLIAKYGSPTGTIYARLRKMSDDSIIETSATTVDITTVLTGKVWYTFPFTSKIDEEVYVSIEYDDGDSDNFLLVFHYSDVIADSWMEYYDGTWHVKYIWGAHQDLAIQLLFAKYSKEKTTDKSNTTYWEPEPANEAGAWMTWGLIRETNCSGCKIYWGADAGYRPTDYKLYVSVNNSDWTEKVHEEADPGASAWKEYNWAKLPVKYIKLIVTTHGASGTRIYEVQTNIEAGGFLGLADTPLSYAGHSEEFVRVKADETGLFFE